MLPLYLSINFKRHAIIYEGGFMVISFLFLRRCLNLGTGED